MMTGTGEMCLERPRSAYSLVEVVVALVILAVGLLGAAGLVATAARHVASAVQAEAALNLAEAVADSLMTRGWRGPGERAVGTFVISWTGTEGWGEVVVRSLDGTPLVRLPVAVLDP